MPGLWDYLRSGIEAGLPHRYLTSRRTPWYAQEKRPPAPFLCTYMGRRSEGSGPFRFIWNRSSATATNVYLMMYPRGNLKEALTRHPGLERAVFGVLQDLDVQAIVHQGRTYGGGLHKVEPRELGRLPATAFSAAIGGIHRGRQLELQF